MEDWWYEPDESAPDEGGRGTEYPHHQSKLGYHPSRFGPYWDSGYNSRFGFPAWSYGGTGYGETPLEFQVTAAMINNSY